MTLTFERHLDMVTMNYSVTYKGHFGSYRRHTHPHTHTHTHSLPTALPGH